MVYRPLEEEVVPQAVIHIGRAVALPHRPARSVSSPMRWAAVPEADVLDQTRQTLLSSMFLPIPVRHYRAPVLIGRTPAPIAYVLIVGFLVLCDALSEFRGLLVPPRSIHAKHPAATLAAQGGAFSPAVSSLGMLGSARTVVHPQKTEWVDAVHGSTADVTVEVHATLKANRILRDKPPDLWIVVPSSVVVEVCLGILLSGCVGFVPIAGPRPAHRHRGGGHRRRQRRGAVRLGLSQGEHATVLSDQSGSPSSPATEMSSSRSGQWIPMPGPISRQWFRCSGVASRRRGNHSMGTVRERPS